LDLSGNDIYTVNLPLGYPSEKESYSDYANVIEKSKFESTPIWAIPALANYYVLVEEDKDPMTSIFAVNHLLKYVPTEFQRAVIFSSIFDEFNLVNINLFQEIKLTPDDYQNLLSRIDFVEVLEGGNRLKEVSRKILFNVCKIIFKDTDFDMLIATSTQIKDKFPGLRYDQFEILRELAYFKVFDKSFVIENYFDNDKNTLQLIETYPEYFERDKSFYAIAPNYSDILIEYNKVCDGEDYALKCQKVEEIYYNYQKEIEKRNAVLQEDVINVGKELEEHSAQKNMMAGEADLFVKQLLNLKGDIKEIDEKLKPFVHINSKKKSTINLIALIVSVAIIFNSDRISEILFGSSSDFGYVILITFILLLGLYGNGLLRYFRVKFKSEELHALKQSKKNKESECEKIQSELDIKNADIRAKEAKIEDLKKHIERMNKQIFENKNKLGKTFMH
jgi:peptidoglycan hydrolase CwlO-like protein